MKKKVVILDFDAGNILSLTRAIESLDYNYELTKNKSKIRDGSFIVLPGDGAFGHAIKTLRKLDLIDEIIQNVKNGKPLLGICLGMQLLTSKSEENGNFKGLSLLEGTVNKIKSDDRKFKVPVIGWRKLLNNKKIVDNFKVKKKLNNKEFYFIHSYEVKTKKNSETLFHYQNYNKKIAAVIGKENILGCQFHPEKSGKYGIEFLKEFLKR